VGYVCDGGVVRMQFPLGYSGGKILECPLESLTALGRASRAARRFEPLEPEFCLRKTLYKMVRNFF